jgi:hypothetical protein
MLDGRVTSTAITIMSGHSHDIHMALWCVVITIRGGPHGPRWSPCMAWCWCPSVASPTASSRHFRHFLFAKSSSRHYFRPLLSPNTSPSPNPKSFLPQPHHHHIHHDRLKDTPRRTEYSYYIISYGASSSYSLPFNTIIQYARPLLLPPATLLISTDDQH